MAAVVSALPCRGASSDVLTVCVSLFVFRCPVAADASYEKLKCGFTPVDRTDSQFKMVQDYVKNTHGHTHTQYTLEVLDLFDLDREGEADKFNGAGFNKTENTQLLWHGSVSWTNGRDMREGHGRLDELPPVSRDRDERGHWTDRVSLLFVCPCSLTRSV